jgi:SecD/SecF fusion protein
MNNSLRWKSILLFLSILFCGISLVPSFHEETPDWWKKYLTFNVFTRGLGLQGGMHLVLKVDLEKAISNNLKFGAGDLEESLKEKNISVVKLDSDSKDEVIFTLPNTGAVSTIESMLKDDLYEDLDIKIDKEEGSFPKITIKLKTEKIDRINKNAVNESLEIIRNRIDQFGVAEPVIIKQGKDEIVVQLPGVEDKVRAKELLGKTAQLEFKGVDSQSMLNLSQLVEEAREAGEYNEKDKDSREKLNKFLQHRLPEGTQIYFETEKNKETGTKIKIPLLLKNQVLMTGKMVKDARVRTGGNFNEPMVSLDFTGKGGHVFGKITEEYVKQRVAIVLDEVVRSAPVIQEKILGGSAQITGSFTYEEAADLAIVLRVGALPAPVKIIQNISVDASLGEDAIDKGLNSGLFGTLLVLIFMIVYYRLSGGIANLALLVNILFLLGGLAAMGATLTLPGIAGIILSIGMAVDANVLIFERMREEFALGKTVKSGIEGGYDKAMWTIIDSQVTTLITAMALFLFGTGPIKGFAVTLSLGVVFNLFTTLFGTRLIYDILYTKGWLRPITFLQFIKKPDFNYIQLKKFAFMGSGLLVLIGILAFTQILRGEANLGVDFTGGTMAQYKTEKPIDLGKVRNIFKDSDYAGAVLQQVANENRLIVKIKKDEEVVGKATDNITKLLNTKYPENKFKMESQSEIGSSVSNALRNKALQAIGISLLGVILYLALRFDISFGVAAAIATFHDVVVVLGICYLTGIEITLLIVTALLTIAGYSLNDSVVVFDRIREHMRKNQGNASANPKKELTEFEGFINSSINEVLSRTMVTSLTSALVLIALFFRGGIVIHDFAFALFIGVLVGTYSSIFIASPILYVWRGKKLEIN